VFDVVLKEARRAALNPGRWGEALKLRRWRQLASVLWFRWRSGDRWSSTGECSGFKHRQYSSYVQYLKHQQSKLSYLDLGEYDTIYRQQLRERLEALPCLKKGCSVLCLGARQGTEVKAFLDVGCFAVGIDLNPGPNNAYVLPGDFHSIQFAAGTVDVAFTNSLDHAFALEKLISEVCRVLKPGGLLIVEAVHGEAEETRPDYYASVWWTRVDDVMELFRTHGFVLVHRTSLSLMWPGEALCFKFEK
jgi:SAM-dependent methyltransferase